MSNILRNTVIAAALLGATPAFATIPCGCPTDDDDTGGQGDGGTVGDPHNISIDGAQYDFFAVGEFTIYQSPSIEIQVRGEQYRTTNYTANTAVAVKTKDHRIGFYAPTASEPALVLVDGAEVAVRDGQRINLDDGSVITRNGRFYSVIDQYNQRVVAGMQTDWMDVWVKGVWTGGSKGMLGNGDGNPNNDFATRDGRTLSLPLTFDKMYNDFGESWRVDESNTLFDYAAGEGPDSFHDRAFHQSRRAYNSRVVREGPLFEESRGACMDAGVTNAHLLDVCAIEIAETGELAFADSIASLPEPSLVVVPIDEDIDRADVDMGANNGEQPAGCSAVPVTAGLVGLGLAVVGAVRRRRE